LQGHLTVLKVTVTVCHTAKHYGEEYDEVMPTRQHKVPIILSRVQGS